MSLIPHIDEVVALSERARHVRDSAGRAQMPEIFLVVYNNLYEAATLASFRLRLDHDTKLPDGVDILDQPFKLDELATWIERVGAVQRLTPSRGSAARRRAWDRLLEALEELQTVMAMYWEGKANKIASPDLQLVRPGGE